MADTKISALPSASTPLTGTEVLPIVQGAGNFKVAVSNLTAGRAVSASSFASSAATGTISVTSTTGTNAAYQSFVNTGGTYYIGVDNSTGATFTGTAYSLFRYAAVGRVIQDVIAGTGVITSASSTGLAVTGALSATAGSAATPLALNTTNASTFVSSYTYNTSTILGYIGNGNGIIGSSASDFGMRSENDLILAAGGGTVRGRFSSTGLAVTGALSSTTGANFATSSGNVGIGTSSPNYSLTSYKSGAVANYLQIVSGATGAAAGNGLLLGVDASGNSVINAQGAINLYTYVAGVLRTTIDSSGYLGVGAAPVAGYYIYSPTIRSPKFYVDSTAWFDGAVANTLGFYTSSSEKMRLDVSGNLLVGTTSSDGSRLRVYGAYQTLGDGAYEGLIGKASSLVSGGGSGDFAVRSAANLVFATSGATERMRLDSSGNLGIGTSSPAYKLQVADNGNFNTTVNVSNTTAGTSSYARFLAISSAGNASFGMTSTTYTDVTSAADALLINASGASGGMVFAHDGVSKMVLDSSGNLLVGTTSAAVYPTQGLSIYGNNGGSALIGMGHATGTASGNAYMTFAYNGTGIGSITQSGTTAVLYNTTSDQRLKENIQDAAPASALIDAIQVRQFDWKSDGSHQRYGFVAQELVTVAPEAVHAPADPDEMMAVDYSKLVPLLVKEVQSLRARVAQLESKP